METLRYLNKEINSNERNNFSNWWLEQINIYGQKVIYYQNASTIESSNRIYGEDVAAGFEVGKDIIILYTLNNDSIFFSKFGLIADGEFAGVIHPTTFTEVFGLSAEPKAGDILRLEEYGIDRINYPKRGPIMWELTEVKDELEINAIAGHYVWFIKAKRYDYSKEPGSPGSGVGNTPSDDNSIADEIAKENFNYLENPCSNSSVYGGYENPPPFEYE
jgi:hypothetical protein